jgi:hypothetical protein
MQYAPVNQRPPTPDSDLLLAHCPLLSMSVNLMSALSLFERAENSRAAGELRSG